MKPPYHYISDDLGVPSGIPAGTDFKQGKTWLDAAQKSDVKAWKRRLTAEQTMDACSSVFTDQEMSDLWERIEADLGETTDSL